MHLDREFEACLKLRTQRTEVSAEMNERPQIDRANELRFGLQARRDGPKRIAAEELSRQRVGFTYRDPQAFPKLDRERDLLEHPDRDLSLDALPTPGTGVCANAGQQVVERLAVDRNDRGRGSRCNCSQYILGGEDILSQGTSHLSSDGCGLGGWRLGRESREN